MSFGEGMAVFFSSVGISGAFAVLDTMNCHAPPHVIGKFLAAGIYLIPALALAHPGHFHPGEEDEFDAIRSEFLHLHGNLEIGLAILALAALLVFGFHRNSRIRLVAAVTLGGSLALLTAI